MNDEQDGQSSIAPNHAKERNCLVFQEHISTNNPLPGDEHSP